MLGKRALTPSKIIFDKDRGTVAPWVAYPDTYALVTHACAIPNDSNLATLGVDIAQQQVDETVDMACARLHASCSSHTTCVPPVHSVIE